MLVLTVVLTAVVALALGLAPAKVARRRVRQCDLGWAAGLWLATWVFAMCAYHRPGLTVGFDAFRLAAITALCGWASFCVAGLRSFGGRGLRFVVPLLLAAALGSEVFVGNVSCWTTWTPTSTSSGGRGVSRWTRTTPTCGSLTSTSLSIT